MRVTGTLKGMAALFSSSPLLALFLVVALGAAIGAIRIGPLRFGAAGALFVGLAVSALHPEVVSNHMSIVQPMGLAFFVYCVGISAGATFFQNLGLRVKMCVWLGVSRGLDLAFLNAD